MIAFVDSSALLKLFLRDEPGREAVRAAMAIGPRSALSRLAYVEVRSGLAAARRSGRLAPAAHDQAVAAFELTWAEYDLIEVDEAVTRRAGDLSDTYGLFAGDAIQLSSALGLAREGVMVIAWDGRLRVAAAAAGLAVLPVSV